jgi:hypothetical protein
MQKSKNIEQELNELGIHIPDSGDSYTVPESYFQHLPGNLLDQIRTQEFEQTLPKINPFDLPTAYFESFPAQLQTRIYLEELPQNNTYTVPAQYFETTANRVLQQVKSEKKGTLTPIRKVSPGFSFISIAASIVLMLTTGFWLINRNQTPSVEQQIAALSNAEVQDYVLAHVGEFGSELSLESIDINAVDLNALEQEVMTSIQLQSISDEELNKFVF